MAQNQTNNTPDLSEQERIRREKLAELQAAPATWLAQQQQGIITTQEYSTLITTEYWMAESGNGYSQYDLYNFDASTQSFVRSTVNGVPVNVGDLLN